MGMGKCQKCGNYDIYVTPNKGPRKCEHPDCGKLLCKFCTNMNKEGMILCDDHKYYVKRQQFPLWSI